MTRRGARTPACSVHAHVNAWSECPRGEQECASPQGDPMKQFLILLFASTLALGQGGRAAPGPCDRPCLEGFINSYLEAMVAHDAKRLQVTPDVRFTEDDIELKLGEGLWKTASGL